MPGSGVDVSETTGHDARWRSDVDGLLSAGVTRMRYPLRWHRIEAEPGVYDWTATDAVLGHLHDRGADAVVDLVHHTSYPEWLDDGFRDRRFGPAYVRYAEAVARRYPWLSSYTLFNEPFATLFLAGHEALWPPYDRGMEGLVRLLRNVLPAVSSASQCWSELLPQARHLWVDTCEHHTGAPGAPAETAAFARDRRHVALDLALQHDLDPERPAIAALLWAGGESLLELAPVRVDVLGLDYYCHSEWWYDAHGAYAPSPRPVGFAALAEHYADRYGLPVVLSETNLRGTPSDRTTWLKYMLEQYEVALARGVPLDGFCWFPFVDSCDWDSLLARPAGRVDPVGVLTLGPGGARVRTSFTDAWEAVAAGATSIDLPAYRLQSPCDEQLAGFLPQLSHWRWQEPPAGELVPPLVTLPHLEEPLVQPDARPAASAVPVATDLVVLSHLRWTWVWQRPQHLVSRFAVARAATGARTWFVEEPSYGDVDEPQLRFEELDAVTRVWLVIPGQGQVHPGFDAEGAQGYGELLEELLAAQGRPERPDVLVYTPLALDIARRLRPRRLAADVMDDLSSFLGAPEGLRLRQRRLLAEADVVFTGGRSLHRSVSQQRRSGCHLFPSGVETAHYGAARRLRAPVPGTVAGYVGVLDERLDLDLVRGVAQALPDWTIRMVGPVAKIDPGSLPQGPNIEYLGQTPYEELPAAMARFDVALMPFALNEATRAISPTKTLEYLAAGLPVVSTRVPDVVADYSGVVHLADDAAGFAAACREVVGHCREDRDRRLRPLQERQEWDWIAGAMLALIEEDREARRHGAEEASMRSGASA